MDRCWTADVSEISLNPSHWRRCPNVHISATTLPPDTNSSSSSTNNRYHLRPREHEPLFYSEEEEETSVPHADTVNDHVNIVNDPRVSIVDEQPRGSAAPFPDLSPLSNASALPEISLLSPTVTTTHIAHPMPQTPQVPLVASPVSSKSTDGLTATEIPERYKNIDDVFTLGVATGGAIIKCWRAVWAAQVDQIASEDARIATPDGLSLKEVAAAVWEWMGSIDAKTELDCNFMERHRLTAFDFDAPMIMNSSNRCIIFK